MPVSWELRGRILIVTVIEDWSGGGPASAIEAAMADERFQPGTSLVMDVRRSRMNPSESEVMARSQWLASLRSKGLSGRLAIVVGPQAYQFGVARMAQAYMEVSEMDVKIFRELEDALQWFSAEEGKGAGG
jgi:hypothetical protein